MGIISKLFFDHNGDFLWASITAGIALVGTFYQTYLNKVNYKRNTINASRIKWIQNVREQSVNFIESCYILISFLKTTTEKSENINGNIVFTNLDTNSRYIKMKLDIQKNGDLLMLYFGPDSSGLNDYISYFIFILTKDLANFEQKGYVDENNNIKHSRTLFSFTEFIRIYLKIEWLKASKLIKDKDSENILKKDEIFIAIEKAYAEHVDESKEWKSSFFSNIND